MIGLEEKFTENFVERIGWKYTRRVSLFARDRGRERVLLDLMGLSYTNWECDRTMPLIR